MKLISLAIKIVAAAIVTISLSTSLVAQAVAVTPDSIAQTFFDKLKAGDTNKAVLEFFGPNSLATEKRSELGFVASQIEAGTGAYGRISNCELVKSVKQGSYVESRMYICQHSKYLTRWQLLFVKTSNGWSGANLTFDDKVWVTDFSFTFSR